MRIPEIETLKSDLQSLKPYLSITDKGLAYLSDYCLSDVSVTPDVGATATDNLALVIEFSSRFHKVAAAVAALRECFHNSTFEG